MLFALAILTVCLFFAVLFGFFALAAVQAGMIFIAVGTSVLAFMLVFSMLSVAWVSVRG